MFKYGIKDIKTKAGNNDLFIRLERNIAPFTDGLDSSLGKMKNSDPLFEKIQKLENLSGNKFYSTRQAKQGDPDTLFRYYRVKVDSTNLFFKIDKQQREIEKQYVAFGSFNETT